MVGQRRGPTRHPQDRGHGTRFVRSITNFHTASSMLEILVIVIAMLVMARKGRPKRRMGKYLRGSADESLSLGTLASKDVISQGFSETVDERTFISSFVARWSMTAFTKSTGDGPILVGIVHSDYTAAEIEEWIENAGSWNEGNLTELEKGARKIRQVGVFENPIDEADSVVLNYGKPIRMKCGWILNQGQTL